MTLTPQSQSLQNGHNSILSGEPAGIKPGSRQLLLSRAADALLLAVTALYILLEDVKTTTFKLMISDDRFMTLLMLLIAAAGVRLAVMLLQNRSEWKKWAVWIAAALGTDLIYFIIYHGSSYRFLAFLAVITLGTVGMDYSKAVRMYTAVTAVFLITTVTTAWCGGIVNYVYIREMVLRSSWGIGYPTDLASYALFTVMFWWAASKKAKGIWFTVPALLVLVLSLAIADSRNGTLCSILLIVMILAEYFLNMIRTDGSSGQSHTSSAAGALKKAAETAMCCALPFLTILTNLMVLLYRRGIGAMIRLDGILSGRLRYAAGVYDDYGISLFGHFFRQIGNGGTTLTRADANFVDISYCLILLRYGIVMLVLVNILWVLMTRKLFKSGDRRLALVMFMIAVHSAIEHHFTEVNFNILLAIPFAVLTAGAVNETTGPEHTESGREASLRDMVTECAGWTAVVLSVLAMPRMLEYARTAMDLSDLPAGPEGRRMMFAAGMVITAAVICGVYSAARLIRGYAKSPGRRTACISTVVIAAIMTGALWGAAGASISSAEAKQDILPASESKAIETAKGAGTGRLYACELPKIYNDKYGCFSSSVFYGEELARYANTSVIMDKETDSACFFERGFMYTPISEEHAFYTNDEPVIRALQEAGYHLTSYYPVLTEVDMEDMARRNDLEPEEDGSVRLSGEEERLKKGPRIDLHEGRYTVTYDLQLVSDAAAGPKSSDSREPVCTLAVKYNKGDYTVEEEILTEDRFDKSGNCRVSVICDMPDAIDTDFCVLPAGRNVVKVKGISYQKTPEYDIHSFYDGNRVKIREEYFDLNGDPYYGDWGYCAKEIGYDERGNVNRELFYDQNGQKVCNTAGFCEVRRKYNELNQAVWEEYYGTDGGRAFSNSGFAARETGYDEFGHQSEVSYYGIQNDPVLIGGGRWGGYHRIRIEYDDAGRIVREYYYGTDDRPVMTHEGYASKENLYDDDGNITGCRYYDTEGKEISVN